MSTQKKIMVLGTNAGQADLIRHMKDRGWFVIGVSPIKGESGQAFCDVVEEINIVDLDALEEAARRHEVDLVYSISSDIAMTSVVALAERLGLPHFYDSEFVALLDNKAAFRAFLKEHDLSPVPFIEVTEPAGAAHWDHFPCMVKPTDAQGQRGVVRIDRVEDLDAAITQAVSLSRSKRAIVEGFLDGVEISCNVMVSDGEVRMKVLSERLVHGPHALGVPRGHLVPCKDVSEENQRAALDLVDGIIAAMGTRDGVLYCQMIVTPEGPRVVEIAPRLDGCHMWRLIRAAENVDLIGMAMDCLTGEGSPETLPNGGEGDRHGRDMELMFQQMAPGDPFDQARFPEPEGSLYHEYRYEDGDDIRPINGTLEVVGYYVRVTP
ncbi:ATPase [Phaeobacter gallaeciensis]|uniref:ATPase n=2 Tax=Roseobacteraceae TaxID=2854170 RepID=A0A366WJM6_9RHOB|nr:MULTISPECIES: ATP-grasp domain-containing protein [Roseobacteraceae]MBT3141771.1 ATP-grasp domain-containing protein [Falsiruegeria litorea]MBT8167147.1 ATP-grasp domain-containing protein [Falsiruegeria litorea]RBW50298.1 ATPase [Phaeobacter gallaeciensis]